MPVEGEVGERLAYPNKVELLLTLVGYAVGFGNIWRFPYLTYTYGGGAFLVPYFLSLALLGVPLFVLELCLGQVLRQGTLGIWNRLGLPRLRGVGAAATACAFFVALYYNVILAWTLYYLGATIVAAVRGDALPWGDMGEGGTEQCAESVLYVRRALASSPFLFDGKTGLLNESHRADFFCPQRAGAVIPESFARLTVRARICPVHAALHYWQNSVLQQSSGMTDLGGINFYMLVAFTVAWLLVCLCIIKGIKTSGKVVYVTATMPYVALVAFFVRAMMLPNAGRGVTFFLKPEFHLLRQGQVWMRAVTQIFYSLGVGFGSLVAFGSYGDRRSNFIIDGATVSIINCGTSVFAGLVVFPILGYLAQELSEINPCIRADDLAGLSSVGLSGTGLAFVAFPIAISRMPASFFWAVLFFVMLLCLGIGSEFALVESVVTVLSDAGVGSRWPRPLLVSAVCVVCYLLGLIFVTRAGIYWFELVDAYACVLALFFVTGMECVGLMWCNRGEWPSFRQGVKDLTGVRLGPLWVLSWKLLCPMLLVAVAVLSINTWDIQDVRGSQPFPEGRGYFPEWSIGLGWTIGLLPVAVGIALAVTPPRKPAAAAGQDLSATVGADAVDKEKAAGVSDEAAGAAA